MTKEEKELLRQQAIEGNNQRVDHIETFLSDFPLDSEVNKSISLELATMKSFIEEDTEKLKQYKY